MGSIINGQETPTVVAVSFHSTRYSENQYEKVFSSAMQVLAQECLRVTNPDLILLQNEIVADVIVSSQNFFEDELNDALRQVGLGFTVLGVGVSGVWRMPDLIKSVYPGSVYKIPFLRTWGIDLSLYKIIK